jgi:Tfp pilus assembly protein PilV
MKSLGPDVTSRAQGKGGWAGSNSITWHKSRRLERQRENASPYKHRKTRQSHSMARHTQHTANQQAKHSVAHTHTHGAAAALARTHVTSRVAIHWSRLQHRPRRCDLLTLLTRSRRTGPNNPRIGAAVRGEAPLKRGKLRCV